MIRLATLKDIDRLLNIESDCFQTDQLSRRNFHYLLTKAHAHTVVDEVNQVIRGYAMLLFSRGTSMARLYSFATSSEFRRLGVAEKLLKAVEEVAKERDCVSLRLETRRDNLPMQQLVKNNGYKKFGTIANYYEDKMDALRFEKSLAPQLETKFLQET